MNRLDNALKALSKAMAKNLAGTPASGNDHIKVSDIALRGAEAKEQRRLAM